MKEDFAGLPEAVLPWYERNRRDLPWRRDREPYHVWLSEIMLQQTRVEAVKGYYARFLEALPTIQDLADCPEDRLQKLWEGLGYYSRVRNLKKAAQVICGEYGGAFPDTYDGVRALPGIGPYTAGAICSIVYEMPTPAVDGNVLRVGARLWDDPTPVDSPAQREKMTRALAEVYPTGHCGDLTQALMELGATVCLPNGAPRCESCPVRRLCLGYANGTARSLPVKQPKREKRREERTVFVFCREGEYALRRRPNRGLLAGMWEFPNVEGHLTPEGALIQAEAWGLWPRELGRVVERDHVFTHIVWKLRCYYLDCVGEGKDLVWFTRQDLERQAALPTAFRQFWEIEQEKT